MMRGVQLYRRLNHLQMLFPPSFLSDGRDPRHGYNVLARCTISGLLPCEAHHYQPVGQPRIGMSALDSRLCRRQGSYLNFAKLARQFMVKRCCSVTYGHGRPVAIPRRFDATHAIRRLDSSSRPVRTIQSSLRVDHPAMVPERRSSTIGPSSCGDTILLQRGGRTAAYIRSALRPSI
jgi:hypothetical protein